MADLLSPREAALRLGISYPTMKQWLYRGKVKAIKTPGGHYRIPQAELDGLLHKARRPETPKRQMLRTVSGRNQLVGRVVEIKVEEPDPALPLTGSLDCTAGRNPGRGGSAHA